MFLLELFFQSKLVGNNAKGRVSKRVFQESKARQKFLELCFLETSVLRFALLPYYQRTTVFE